MDFNNFFLPESPSVGDMGVTVSRICRSSERSLEYLMYLALLVPFDTTAEDFSSFLITVSTDVGFNREAYVQGC